MGRLDPAAVPTRISFLQQRAITSFLDHRIRGLTDIPCRWPEPNGLAFPVPRSPIIPLSEFVCTTSWDRVSAMYFARSDPQG